MRKLVFLILAILAAVFGSKALQRNRGAGIAGGGGFGEPPSDSAGHLKTTDGAPVQDV